MRLVGTVSVDVQDLYGRTLFDHYAPVEKLATNHDSSGF